MSCWHTGSLTLYLTNILQSHFWVSVAKRTAADSVKFFCHKRDWCTGDLDIFQRAVYSFLQLYNRQWCNGVMEKGLKHSLLICGFFKSSRYAASQLIIPTRRNKRRLNYPFQSSWGLTLSDWHQWEPPLERNVRGTDKYKVQQKGKRGSMSERRTKKL